jgi:hypothetical protein
VTVPSGTAAPLSSGFRLTSLAAPLTLAPGDYSVIAYQLNGSGVSDEYGEATNNGFNGSPNVSSTGFTTFAFTSNPSPDYPTGGSTSSNLASASFAYNNVPEPASLGLLLGLGGLGLMARRRA